MKQILLHPRIDVLPFTKIYNTLSRNLGWATERSLELDPPPLLIGEILMSSSRCRADFDDPSSALDLKSLD